VSSQVVRPYLVRDLKAGIVKPIKANVFEASELEQAFRFMARYFKD
jgi:hypothetical protein